MNLAIFGPIAITNLSLGYYACVPCDDGCAFVVGAQPFDTCRSAELSLTELGDRGADPLWHLFFRGYYTM